MPDPSRRHTSFGKPSHKTGKKPYLYNSAKSIIFLEWREQKVLHLFSSDCANDDVKVLLRFRRETSDEITKYTGVKNLQRTC